MAGFEKILWYPTMACNCNCAHCGQSHRVAEDECSPELIGLKLLASKRFAGCRLSLAGGEPFVKKGLVPVLAELCNSGRLRLIDITTNGTCTEEIRKLCDLAPDTIRTGMAFAVSIDGLPEIHNRIRKNPTAFESAIQSVKLLQHRGVRVQINCVMQRQNLDTLGQFTDRIARECGDVPISLVPEICEFGGKETFSHTPEDVEKMMPYVEQDIRRGGRFGNVAGKLYLQTSGSIRMKNCHAGQKAVVLAPSGSVYACTPPVGDYRNSTLEREQFCIGSLKDSSLDEIIQRCEDADAPFRAAVRNCEGCWMPCELGNELEYHNILPEWHYYMQEGMIDALTDALAAPKVEHCAVRIEAGDMEVSCGTAACEVRVTLENIGQERITSRRREPIYLSYHLLDGAGKVLVYDGERTAINEDIRSGETTQISMKLKVPESLRTGGHCTVRITLVAETLFWADTNGENLKDITLRISG